MRILRRLFAETRDAIGCIRGVAVYAYSYRYRLLLLALLSPLASVPALLTPLVMQLLIDKAYPTRDLRLLAWLCAALLVLRLVPNVLVALSGYLSTYIQHLVQYKLCFRVLNAIERLPQSYRERYGSGMFLERAMHDTSLVAQSVAKLAPEIMTTVITFLAIIPLMLRLNVRIALLALAVVPVNYVLTACLTRRLRRLHEAKRTIDERIVTFASETIEGATITRLFSLGRLRRRKLKQLFRDHFGVVLAAWRATMSWGQAGNLVSSVWSLVLLCGGWYLVFSGRLQLGQAVALSMYINLLARPFQQVAKLYQKLINDSVSARRILEVLNECRAMTENQAPRKLAHPPRCLELHNLSFAYKEGRLCLGDLSLRMRGGHTIAVIGSSGAGKSTLLRILSGLDDRYEGRFLVDGCELREICRDSYLRHVSLIPQTTFFFSESIRENLCPCNRLTSAESLRRSAHALGLDALIDAAPDGYDTKLGSDGVRLSAGQYQKLAAMRAMLKDASILLLDEATSSMDIESERQLLQGILALRSPDCVTLLVTHHVALTTESWVDEIVVMAHGRIAEMGSYAELLRKRGLYHRWLSLNQTVSLDRAIQVDQMLRQQPSMPEGNVCR